MNSCISATGTCDKNQQQQADIDDIEYHIIFANKIIIDQWYNDHTDDTCTDTDQLFRQEVRTNAADRNASHDHGCDHEQDQLKIIEERTGEFKLDFGTNDVEKQNSLIDEIDDDMSLDELMSLYEKKFKD